MAIGVLILTRIVRVYKSVMRALQELQSKGIYWDIVSISCFAGVGLLYVAVSHGLYSEYIGQFLKDLNAKATLGAATMIGIIGLLSSALGIFVYLASIHHTVNSNQVRLFAYGSVPGFIVWTIGLVEAYLVPGMLNPLNFLDIWILGMIVAVGSFFLLQKVLYEAEARGYRKLTELKLFHAETLEVLRTLIWAAVISIAGFALVGIGDFLTTFRVIEAEQAAEKAAIIQFVLLAYFVLGYTFLCLLPLYQRLHWIRQRARQSRYGKSVS